MEPTVSDVVELWHNPHNILGLHDSNDGHKVVRVFRPGAEVVNFEVFGSSISASKTDVPGLFQAEVPLNTTYKDYRIYHQNGLLACDPYAFSPTFGEMDSYLYSRGVHYQLYEVLGAHYCVHQEIAGVKFAVWAPNAKSVSLVGDFNFWDGRTNPMRNMGNEGVWELFVPGLGLGEKYKFEIRTQEGKLRLKADPFANFSEMRPATASIVVDVDRYQWTDGDWMQNRLIQSRSSYPLNIYEVHLGSWKKRGHHFLNYRELAHELAKYCTEMGFTHVELMPIEEHPLDESWGYQVTGFFAVTSRYGSPEDFQYFVDYMHQNGIGVILDWVPAHFPTDDFSLAQFDGSYLYEHADPRRGFHPHWNTYIFNYGRFEISNFLIASALFWLDKMHIDGLRVDAVASMLYLDYGRKVGEWIPNIYGGNENLEAIEFIKHLNSIVHDRFPHVLICAEESTSFTGVTHPLEWGGLGFDLKWNMGWMNDTLRYFHKDPLFRSHHQNDLTFGLVYAFSERFMLVLSHDEVVHGKASLLSKMPGDDWQKFANMRLLYSYMLCQPGKKLFFMGGELGMWNEWHCKEELPWQLLQYDRHRELKQCIQALNHLYLARPAFWEFDFESQGFEWIDFSDQENCVISYLRKGKEGIAKLQFGTKSALFVQDPDSAQIAYSKSSMSICAEPGPAQKSSNLASKASFATPSKNCYLVCVHNFTPNFHADYFIHLPNITAISEVFNTDGREFGGSGKINSNIEIVKSESGSHVGFKMQLAPLATMIFEVTFVS